MWQAVPAFLLGVALATVVAWRLSVRWARRLRQHDRKLLRRTRRAERLAELGSLTGHLAHEIRNPLSTIKLNLQLLSEDIARLSKSDQEKKEGQGVDGSARHYKRQLRKIETITKETDRLADTLNDFLQYAGKMELHPGRHELNELLDDLMDFFEPQASSKAVQIRRSLNCKPLYCRVDAEFLKQAFLNLFINAVQVMDEGGELIVRSSEQDRSAVIDVIDTGPGIAREDQNKIFDAYYTTRAGGTGLGLPTCRRIIEELGGHIELQSDLGKGTYFRIELPLMEDCDE